jgi:Ca-activated chloride channel family protein
VIVWGHPEFAALWVLWGLGAWLAFRLLHWRERRLGELLDPQLWPLLLPDRDGRRLRRWLAWWLAAMACVIVALMMPQWGERPREVRRRSMQIVIALDTSRSMLAQDLKPSRFQYAKWGIRDLVKQLRGDRVALVAFAGRAFVQCPLTFDYGAFLLALEEVQVGSVPRGGTSLEEALRVAMEAFDDQSGGARVIVLVTDGEYHEGDPMSVLDELRSRGIRVYAVGVGTPEGELIPDGGGFFKDRQGNVVKTRLREDVVVRLCAATQGMYVRARPGDPGFEHLYKEGMAQLERAEAEQRLKPSLENRADVFLALAWILFAIESLTSQRRRLMRSAAVLGLVAVGGLPVSGMAAPASDPRRAMNEGIRHYEMKQYEEAVRAFEQAARAAEAAPESKLDPAIARYNQALALLQNGANAEEVRELLEHALHSTNPEVYSRALFARGWAHARQAMLEQERNQVARAWTNAVAAAHAFQDALRLNPFDDDARWNYEVVQRLLEQLRSQTPSASSGTNGNEQSTQPLQRSETGESQQPETAEPMNQTGGQSPEPSPPENSGASQTVTETPPTETPEAAGTPSQPRSGTMTREEAEMLLDQVRAEEAALRMRIRQSRAPPLPVEKDW